MTISPISAALTQSDRDAVMDAVATIKTKLPFLVDLSAEVLKLTIDAQSLNVGAICSTFRVLSLIFGVKGLKR